MVRIPLCRWFLKRIKILRSQIRDPPRSSAQIREPNRAELKKKLGSVSGFTLKANHCNRMPLRECHCRVHSSLQVSRDLKKKEEEEEKRMSSWRGKRKDEEDPAKRDSSSDDSSVVCEISKNRRVTVRNWNGKVIVDIREFYVKDGKQMPGKKGISLPMDQWTVLRSHVDEIDKVVNETA